MESHFWLGKFVIRYIDSTGFQTILKPQSMCVLDAYAGIDLENDAFLMAHGPPVTTLILIFPLNNVLLCSPWIREYIEILS